MCKPTFLILAHDDPQHFNRLINRLENVGNIVAHIDAKVDQTPFKASISHVVFVSNRITINWAGYSIVRAELELLRCALESFSDSSHFVLLSGADYPIKSTAYLRQYFRSHVGHNFIKFFDIRTSTDHYSRSLRGYHFRDYIGGTGASPAARGVRKLLELLLYPTLRTWPSDLTPCFGSQWWALTPECASYVVDRVKREAFWTSFWKYSFAPDELFFHTLIGNSPFREKSDGLVDFAGRGNWRFANIHHLHASLTKIYSVDDFAEIKSSDKLFVRKVSSYKSDALLDLLDQIDANSSQ